MQIESNVSMPSRSSWKHVGLGLTAGISFFLCGYDLGLVNATREEADLKDLFMIFSAVASIIGAGLSSMLVFFKGKRKALMTTDIIFLVSYGFYALGSKWIAALSRILCGFAIGMANTVSPIIVAEISPSATRGILVGIHGLMFTTGLMLASFVSFILNQFSEFTVADEAWRIFPDMVANEVWRVFPGPAILFAIIQISCVFFMDPSTRDHTKIMSIKIFFEKLWTGLERKVVRKALAAGILAQISKSVVGMNFILFYGPDLMKQGGYPTMEFGTNVTYLGFFGTIISLILVDRVGRKNLLLGSLSTMFVSLLSLFVLFNNSTEGISSIVIAYIFTFLYSLAFSAVPITVNSEIYPSEFRAMGSAIAAMVSSLFALCINITFTSLKDMLGGKLLIIHAVCCLVAIILTCLVVPETAKVPLEEMEALLERF